MSVVTLDGRAFPSVINVRVDVRLRRYVPCGAGPVESGQESGHNRDTVQIESPAVQNAPECDRDALLALADTFGSVSGELCDGCMLKDGCAGATCALGVAHEAARRIREACGEVAA